MQVPVGLLHHWPSSRPRSKHPTALAQGCSLLGPLTSPAQPSPAAASPHRGPDASRHTTGPGRGSQKLTSRNHFSASYRHIQDIWGWRSCLSGVRKADLEDSWSERAQRKKFRVQAYSLLTEVAGSVHCFRNNQNALGSQDWLRAGV